MLLVKDLFANIRPKLLNDVGQGVISNLRGPDTGRIFDRPLLTRMITVRRDSRRYGAPENLREIELRWRPNRHA